MERCLVQYAAESNGEVEVTAARAGLITSQNATLAQSFINMAAALGLAKSVGVDEIAAALIDQVVNGIEKDPLDNDDLARIGRKVLAESKK